MTKAYAVTLNSDNKSAHLEPITGTVAANTPVLLKADAGTYAVKKSTDAATTVTTALTVSDGTVKGGDQVFVLASIDGTVGFYKTGSDVTIPAGKCYLQVASGAKTAFLALDDTVTVISAPRLDDNAEDAPAYNLAGQRVGAGYRGIVIRNGRKFLQK